MSLKVLVVEPDWRFARLACDYLESHAHLVVQEPKPHVAVGQASQWQPDLVIVAAELAETGVIEAMEHIRPRPAVLVTGWMDRYDIAWRAWQRGGDELLMKPIFTIDDLHTAIVTALENATAGIRKLRHIPSVASA